jgi:LPPG:FO 2-phospho-L-lactate transferase
MMLEGGNDASKVLVLSGGVGGARMASGFAQVLPAGALTVLVNTGDDFNHLGLSISPDLDTVMYTLAGIVNPDTGWGRSDETWSFMGALEALGGEAWFLLGDKDLAVHVERTRRLRSGESLSAITAAFCQRLGISAEVLPMSDDPVATLVEADNGILPFQDYFVRHRCAPRVRSFQFAGAASARPHPRLVELLADPELTAVVIAPSNPFVSVAPILAIPGVRDALKACRAPIVAVSPLIAGRTVKGPAGKMIEEMGGQPSASWVASHYADLVDGLVIDSQDAALAQAIQRPAVCVTQTLMRDQAARDDLARAVLRFAKELAQ